MRKKGFAEMVPSGMPGPKDLEREKVRQAPGVAMRGGAVARWRVDGLARVATGWHGLQPCPVATGLQPVSNAWHAVATRGHAPRGSAK